MTNKTIWSGWKVIAIVFLTLFIVQNGLLIWAYKSVEKDDMNTIECYYNVCSEYPEADFDIDTGVCSCYDYDLIGDIFVAETKVIK